MSSLLSVLSFTYQHYLDLVLKISWGQWKIWTLIWWRLWGGWCYWLLSSWLVVFAWQKRFWGITYFFSKNASVGLFAKGDVKGSTEASFLSSKRIPQNISMLFHADRNLLKQRTQHRLRGRGWYHWWAGEWSSLPPAVLLGTARWNTHPGELGCRMCGRSQRVHGYPIPCV